MSIFVNEPTRDVFTHVIARPLAGNESLHGLMTYLSWSAPLQGDRLVQVYVDGELYDTTLNPAQRSMSLLLSAGVSHRIELLAMSHKDVATSHAHLLQGSDLKVDSHVGIALLRDPGAGVGQRVCVDLAGVLSEGAPLYGTRDARSGFGSVFGVGGFGVDAATGPGLGHGELGYGPLGADGEAWRWENAQLPAGPQTISITMKDAKGQIVSEALEIDAEVSRLPLPVDGLSLSPELELSWT